MNDHLRGNALIFYQILSSYSLWKMEISLETLFVDIERRRLLSVVPKGNVTRDDSHRTLCCA